MPNTTAAEADGNNAKKRVRFKDWAPFNKCMREINNTQTDNAHDIDVVMSMYNLIEYGHVYSKT